jgi:glyoxylase-like metal-dependent hydrolase (beta-lactamase superfamily II)
MLMIEHLPVGPLMTNCFLIWDPDSGTGAIIDPGENAERIIERIEELPGSPRFGTILATHCHFDHIGAVAPLMRKIDAEFIIHREDQLFVEDCEEAAKRWGFRIERPMDPDRYITGGEVIEIGDEELRVLHTPGHSPGSVSYVHGNVVFSGDCLFRGSIGRTDFRMGSFPVLERSIREKLYTLPDETTVYTGHGPSTTIGWEKRNNQFVRG